MKNKNIIAIVLVVGFIVVVGLAFSSSGTLFQGALRNTSGITRTITSTTPSETSTSTNYLIAPEEFQGCKSNAEAGTIVLTSNDSPTDFSNFVSQLNQEFDNNNGYARCHYRMYATKGNTIGDSAGQDRVRVSCKSNIEAENNEIRCLRYDQDTPSDTNYFVISITPDKATVTTHSTYYAESINRVEHFDTYWIEQTEK